MNKNRTSRTLLIALFIGSLVLSACSSSDSDENDSNPLFGVWRAEVEEKGELQYWEMTYNPDYTYSFIEYNKDNKKVHNQGSGRYELIDNNTIKMMPTGEEAYTGRFIITDGNKLEFLDYDHGIIWKKISSFGNSKDDNSVKKRTIHVARAGTLADYISDDEKYQIEELTITGTINGVDFRILREMAGQQWHGHGSPYYEKRETEGKLSYLDLSGAKIVAGGSLLHYLTIDDYFDITLDTDNVIPHLVFYGCKKLKTIKISNDIHCIGSDAFSGTGWYEDQPDGFVYLGKVLYAYKGKMPDKSDIKIKEGTVGIANAAFRDCEGLNSISIPNSVISIGLNDKLYRRDVGVFKGCKNLKSVFIPSSVTMIGYFLFIDCENLQTVKVKIESPRPIVSPIEPWNTDIYGKITLIVPKGTKATYESTNGWKDFRNIVEDTE